MSQFNYNATRAEFEKAAKGLNFNFDVLGGGYASKATACAWVGWCLRLQLETEKK